MTWQKFWLKSKQKEKELKKATAGYFKPIQSLLNLSIICK